MYVDRARRRLEHGVGFLVDHAEVRRELLARAARQAAGAALRGYVPGAILARLDAGQTAWLSEVRHLSVLFLGLPDLDDITPGTLVAMAALVTRDSMIGTGLPKPPGETA